MGNNFWNKVQYGKESSNGTAVAATKILLGKMPPIKADRKLVVPEENIGIRAKGTRAVIHQYLYANTLSTEHGYFQELPWLFGCGLKGGVTPSEQTPAQGDYLWDQTPSLVAGVLNNPDSSTIELGDDTQAYRAEYAMFERIRIRGQVSQGMTPSPVNVEADFFGRQLTNHSFTSALSLPTAEPMNAKLARLYVDTAWSGVGGTELANVLRGFDIEIITGVHPKFSGSGNKYFNAHGEGLISFIAQFTLESNSTGRGIFTTQQTDPPVFNAVRLEIDGRQIGSGTNHSLKIDMGGYWETVDPINSEDRSDNLLTATLIDSYDATGAKLLQVKTVTSVNSY